MGLDGPSSEIGSTTNLSRGNAACSRSRLGISFTQGAHQVAHRLISTRLAGEVGEPQRLVVGVEEFEIGHAAWAGAPA